MFEMGFSEMLLIAVVALVVLGPERLPKVARTAGQWLGRLQHFVANIKTDLSTQAGMAELVEAKDGLTAAARQLQQELSQSAQALNADLPDWQQRPAWERLPPQRSPADFAAATPSTDWPRENATHTVSLRRQALQRKRDLRPRPRARPQLRVRRHSLPE